MTDTDISAPLPQCVRVLVVDDHADTAEMLSMALTVMGFEVAVANTGLDGLRLLKEWQPDVAIVDFLMPDIGGIEMARRARSDNDCRKMPLIALTGYHDPRLWDEAQAAGFNAYLVKPVDMVNLKKVIEAVCTPRSASPG